MPEFPEAACHGKVELFNSTGKRSAARAKSICVEQCPHLLDCLEWALIHREPFGTWGGTTEAERQQLFREERLHRHPARSLAASA